MSRSRDIANFGSTTADVTDLNYAKTLYDTGVTDTEFDHLDGVTSGIQTQMDGKSPTTGHSSIATVGTVTSGTISTGTVVDDPTMTQGSDAEGDVYYRASDGKLTRLATGADGTVLTSTGTTPPLAFEAVAGSVAGTCHFRAYSDAVGWDTMSANEKCEFNQVKLDGDGVYDTTNEWFEAPADGVYLFGAHLYTLSSATESGFAFYVGEVEPDGVASGSGYESMAYHYSSDSDDNLLVFSYVLTLSNADTVSVHANIAGDFYPPHSQWWGVRLK